MKIIHLSDLHIGKRIHEFSLLEDQAYILNEIVSIAVEQQVDVMLLAGDIYDKTIPPASAVELFDQFLVDITNANIKVCLISGNHDSPERIAFGGRLMEEKGVYVSPVYHKDIQPAVMFDQYGEVNIYLLPFIKPIHVREEFPEEKVESYTQAVRIAVEHLEIDTEKRNILVTHQFVTGAIRSESEDISVGGTDNVDAEIFGEFDYVALGHIHSTQFIKNEKIRYCGTPLKYSFSEAKHQKSVTIVELNEKGNIVIDTVLLKPLRDMQALKGTFEDMQEPSIYHICEKDSYVHVSLTDEEEIPDVMAKLRVVFPNIMKMDYDNTRTKNNQRIEASVEACKQSPIELFEELYQKQNNANMKAEQINYLEQAIEDIWREK